MRIRTKQSDRFIVEVILGEKIDEYLRDHGREGLITVYYAAHLANTAVESASTGRSNTDKAYDDKGYDLARSLIKEYRRSKVIQGFVEEATGKQYQFTVESVSRFYQNMEDFHILYELLDTLREAIDLESRATIAEKKISTPELQRLETMLKSDDYVTSLYVNVVEVNKLLRPYLHLLSENKEAFEFYPALVDIADRMKDLDVEKFLFEDQYQLYPEHCVTQHIPATRKSIRKSEAVDLMKKTIEAWRTTLELVLVEFRPGGKFSNADQRTARGIPAVSDQAESIVGSASFAKRQVPNGSAKYIDSLVKVRRNEFPPFTFITGLDVEQRRSVNKIARDICYQKTEKSQQSTINKKALQDALISIEKYDQKQKAKAAKAVAKEVYVVETNLENDQTQPIEQSAVASY